MNTTPTRNRLPLSARMLAVLLGAGAAVGGCAYGGIATTSDGTVLVARNSLLGGLRKIYACKLTGTTMTCVETTNPP